MGYESDGWFCEDDGSRLAHSSRRNSSVGRAVLAWAEKLALYPTSTNTSPILLASCDRQDTARVMEPPGASSIG
jgi:hypothetical protein